MILNNRSGFVLAHSRRSIGSFGSKCTLMNILCLHIDRHVRLYPYLGDLNKHSAKHANKSTLVARGADTQLDPRCGSYIVNYHELLLRQRTLQDDDLRITAARTSPQDGVEDTAFVDATGSAIFHQHVREHETSWWQTEKVRFLN